MGYKLLGFVVWQGGKWYLRRRLRGASRKLAMAGAAGAAGIVIVTAIAVQRRAAREE